MFTQHPGIMGQSFRLGPGDIAVIPYFGVFFAVASPGHSGKRPRSAQCALPVLAAGSLLCTSGCGAGSRNSSKQLWVHKSFCFHRCAGNLTSPIHVLIRKGISAAHQHRQGLNSLFTELYHLQAKMKLFYSLSDYTYSNYFFFALFVESSLTRMLMV